ncbi:MAG: YraN family protein [Akkermansia sp.]|nr:YraN family protein [Akkermansia sp.]
MNCPWSAETRLSAGYQGRYGELVAASWLRTRGMKVLRKNFRWGNHGEIDLVCREEDTLVFVEVKSARSHWGGAPSYRITEGKRSLMRQGARYWCLHLQREVPVRFDVVEVWLQGGRRPVLRHTPSAFPPVG